MAIAVKKYFGIPMDFLGNLGHDNKIAKGLLQRKPLIAYLPRSKLFKELTEITKNISPSHQLGLNFPVA